MELKITKGDIDFLVEYAKKELPYEAVAILLGIRRNGEFLVKVLRPVKNVLRSTIEFQVDPIELYSAYLEAEKRGLEVIGIFHSHPAPPHPSPLDVKYMRLNPVVWLIASSINWAIKAFIFKGEVKEVKMKIMEKI